MKLYQLANDPATYGDNAGKWLVVSDDLEQELTLPLEYKQAALFAAAGKLLEYAESVANHRSNNLHGFHSGVVIAARQVVKAAGGNLEQIGRYRAGEDLPMSWDDYDKWERSKEFAAIQRARAAAKAAEKGE